MEKTDKEQKSEMIKAIAEALDKNTKSLHDVWSVLHAIQDGLAFMEDKRYKYRHDLSLCIRTIREKLQGESVGTKQIYDDITDDLQEAIMIAGENAEGIILVNSKSMRSALNEISDQYNN